MELLAVIVGISIIFLMIQCIQWESEGASYSWGVLCGFATFAFIYDLKGDSKVKPIPSAIIAVVVTAVLYLMFVYGFQVRLPRGKIF